MVIMKITDLIFPSILGFLMVTYGNFMGLCKFPKGIFRVLESSREGTIGELI
jgi:hypothetical protein